jgi:hypothetical protein
MAEQVARGLGGQLSQPTLLWPSMGGLRRPRAAAGCGGRRGFFLAVGEGKRTLAVGVAASAMERRRSAQQGNIGEGKWFGASVGWARGGQGGGRERTRGLSGPTHFGPKSETGMGAHGRLRTTLSIWVAPLGRVFCPRGRVRTQGGRLRRPAGDALTARKVVDDGMVVFKTSSYSTS